MHGGYLDCKMGQMACDSDIGHFACVMPIKAGSLSHWLTALQMIADRKGFELPEEWCGCVIRCYTPQQKLFAEICRDVIAPEVERVMRE